MLPTTVGPSPRVPRFVSPALFRCHNMYVCCGPPPQEFLEHVIVALLLPRPTDTSVLRLASTVVGAQRSGV
eukprot:381268-Lingulodinium_polyedra.AAC.1